MDETEKEIHKLCIEILSRRTKNNLVQNQKEAEKDKESKAETIMLEIFQERAAASEAQVLLEQQKQDFEKMKFQAELEDSKQQRAHEKESMSAQLELIRLQIELEKAKQRD
jgi:hypothetical protein